ncbi:MAG: hypothetical protein N2315_08955, partial [Thermanaerothrix sp.]|nr:hypothetical protein [Thermanaerothrix sp.]
THREPRYTSGRSGQSAGVHSVLVRKAPVAGCTARMPRQYPALAIKEKEPYGSYDKRYYSGAVFTTIKKKNTINHHKRIGARRFYIPILEGGNIYWYPARRNLWPY